MCFVLLVILFLASFIFSSFCRVVCRLLFLIMVISLLSASSLLLSSVFCLSLLLVMCLYMRFYRVCFLCCWCFLLSFYVFATTCCLCCLLCFFFFFLMLRRPPTSTLFSASTLFLSCFASLGLLGVVRMPPSAWLPPVGVHSASS